MPEISTELLVPHEYQRSTNVHLEDNADPMMSNKNKFDYGTAGFRTKAKYMPFIVFRMGLLAVIRARYVKGNTGLMITASHNPSEDNGVKLVDPTGAMMTREWEDTANELIDCRDDFLSEFFFALVSKARSNLVATGKSENRIVFVGYDTRPSSTGLAQAAFHGIRALNNDFINLGLVTTPQLHVIVAASNSGNISSTLSTDAYIDEIYCKPLIYALNQSYNKLMYRRYSNRLYVDCANGVGGIKLKDLLHSTDVFDLKLVNIGEGDLNSQCGADFVKIRREFPVGMEDIGSGERCASFDGDADRLVYFYRDAKDKFKLLDGDKIAALIAKYLSELLKAANIMDKFTIAAVQTGYSNGKCTEYMRDLLGIHVSVVPTGVKYLHAEATKYDVGIYFEANGHGTVLFSEYFLSVLNTEVQANKPLCLTSHALMKIKWFTELINSVVGDAMADLLVVETILMFYDWNVEDWNNLLYIDRPSVQKKVEVPERSIFAEGTTSYNAVLQFIDSSLYKDSRCFIRPSGTENIVRVYAEAATEEQAERLSTNVADEVRRIADNANFSF